MNLNEDVLIEILLRLPVKSLLRFRYVCKAWYALIKSSSFTHKHQAFLQCICSDKRIIVKYFKGAENKYVVSLYNDFESLSFFIVPPPPEIEIPGYSNFDGSHCIIHFVGETNGIFCLSNKYDISLMNPVLREFRMLPAFHDRACGRHEFGLEFGFDEANKEIGVGFGFDESTIDYKVLRLDYSGFNEYKGCQYQFGAVYSLNNNTWRDLGRIHLLDSYYLNSTYGYVFFNGSIHWYAMGISVDDGIFAFNVTTELFQEMEAPEPFLSKYAPSPGLFVLENSFMAMISFSKADSDRLFNVWVMKEYGVPDSWTKEYCIQTESCIERPLSFWKNDKLLSTCSDPELACYDLPTGQLHQLQQFERSSLVWDSVGLMVFNESLISIS